MEAQFAKPKVSELCMGVVQQENVGGLDVAVDDGRVGVGVKVVQGPSHVEGDGEAVGPREYSGAAAVVGVHSVEEGLAGSVLQEKKLLAFFQAEAHQAHHVGM